MISATFFVVSLPNSSIQYPYRKSVPSLRQLSLGCRFANILKFLIPLLISTIFIDGGIMKDLENYYLEFVVI